MPPTRFATTIERGVDQWAPVLVFAALPTLGLVAGPSYSSLIIGLAIIQLLSGLAAGRGLPSIDRPLAVLAALFVVLCWASVAWSINQRESMRAALGLTGVLLALLVFRGGRYGRPEAIETLFRALLIATLLGIAVACLDVWLGYPLESATSTKPGVHAATKYNRGFDYLVLIAWPLLAHIWCAAPALGGGRAGPRHGGDAGANAEPGGASRRRRRRGRAATGLGRTAADCHRPGLRRDRIRRFPAGGVAPAGRTARGAGAVPERLRRRPAGDLGLHDRAGVRAPDPRLGSAHRHVPADPSS